MRQLHIIPPNKGWEDKSVTTLCGLRVFSEENSGKVLNNATMYGSVAWHTDGELCDSCVLIKFQMDAERVNE